MESLNPTGSYKDRGSAVLLSALAARGVKEAVENLSGNAGASFAASAARANIKARVFVPGLLLAQNAARLKPTVQIWSASLAHALPRRMRCGARRTRAPVCQPCLFTFWPGRDCNHCLRALGTTGAGAWHGNCSGRAWRTSVGPDARFFRAAAGWINSKAALLCGRAGACCAPVWSGFTNGPASMKTADEGPTLAEGVRVRYPVRADAILKGIGVFAR